MNDLKELIRKNFKKYRVRAGLSQSDLAKQLGVRPSAISNWENGRNSIDVDTLFKVCKIYGIPIDNMTMVFDENKEYERLAHRYHDAKTMELINDAAIVNNDNTLPESLKRDELGKIEMKYEELYNETLPNIKYNHELPRDFVPQPADSLVDELIDRLNLMTPRQRMKVIDAVITLLDYKSL